MGLHSIAEADKDIKDEINAWEYNHELFWLARKIYAYLKRGPVNATRIHPRPPRVQAETDMLISTVAEGRLRDYIESQTTPAKSYNDGTSMVTLKTAFAQVAGITYDSGVPCPAMLALLTGNGVEVGLNGTRRVLCYKYPGETRLKTIKLKGDTNDTN